MHSQGRTGNNYEKEKGMNKDKEEKEITNLYNECIVKLKETTTPSKQ